MATISLDAPKLKALEDLIEAIKIGELHTYNFRDVAGRNPGYHASLLKGQRPSHLMDPSEKSGGKRRKMIGGAACDSRYVSLAIDSAIILAGTTITLGSAYGGYKVLEYYMTTFGFDEATKAIIKSIYDVTKTSGNAILEAIPSIKMGVASMASASSTMASAAIRGTYSAAAPVASAVATSAPLVAAGRYIGTGISASADANAVIAALQGQYAELQGRAGAITRSVAEKRDAIQEQIVNARAAATQKYETALEVYNQGQASVTQNFQTTKERICRLIDAVIAAPGELRARLPEIPDILGIRRDYAMGGKLHRKSKRKHSNKKRTHKKRKGSKRKTHRRYKN